MSLMDRTDPRPGIIKRRMLGEVVTVAATSLALLFTLAVAMGLVTG